MNGRHAGLGLFLVVTTAFASYGVFSTPDPRPVAYIGEADQFVCALPQDAGGFLAAPPPPQVTAPRPKRGTVPDAFEPAVAVVCDVNLGDHAGPDGAVTYVERRYSGDFTSAITKLNISSARAGILDAHCGDYVLAPAPVDMWLVDTGGRAVQPSYPAGDCGLPDMRGLFEIEALPPVGSVEHRLRVDATGIAYFFSCSSTAARPSPGPLPMDELLVLPSGFCRFDTTGTEPVFLGADRFEPDEQFDWYTMTSDLDPAGPCAQSATSVVTTSTSTYPREGIVNVDVHFELDGCRRILADGYTPVTAPAALLESIRRAKK